MKTETLRGCPEGGFTLIEVTVSLILLAVGLLGLQSLGVSAVRLASLAERNTRAAEVAITHLEDGVHELRQGTVPEQYCTTLSNGDVVSRAVVMTSGSLSQVTVTVTPRGTPVTTYSVSSYAFYPRGLVGTPSGSPCA